MPVTIWLHSGERRVLESADGATQEGFFIRFTRSAEGGPRVTVLTLRTQDVVRAEIEKQGAHSEFVPAGFRDDRDA